MSFSFEVDADLEPAWMEDNCEVVYEQPFVEEDFEALGIDPEQPTAAKPGSDEKVTMLSARYAAGLPLWHDEDCCDHGPEEGSESQLDEAV